MRSARDGILFLMGWGAAGLITVGALAVAELVRLHFIECVVWGIAISAAAVCMLLAAAIWLETRE